METTTPKTIKEGQAAFVPIPDLDKMAVGHAGLYPVDSDIDNIEEITAETIDPIIAVGAGKGCKILLDIEDGIKTFIKDGLAAKSPHELDKYGLARDMERVKAIPDKMTGVIIYYLTKGIEKDFGITWDKTPVCLRAKATANKSDAEKAREKGKRILSKKEKNELLAKLTYQYYENDVNSGAITQAEAFAKMAEAAAEKKELEDAGYFLSPNKTQGVALYDWKSEVKEKLNSDDSVLKIYNRHSIIPLVPCLEDKINKLIINPKAKKEIDKSIICGIPFVDAKSFMKNTIKEWEKMKDHYEPRTFHIAKINQSGKMRDRWFVVDAVRKADGAQVLLMWDKNGVDGLLE
jgi:hypothetical protein